MTRKIVISKCACGNIKSATAKQCRECYKKNGGMWNAAVYRGRGGDSQEGEK